MKSDYAFIMTVNTFKGYYIYKKGRYYLVYKEHYPTGLQSNYIISHMDNSLSYDALMTRMRRVKTYMIERVLFKDIEQELMLKML